jgi:hypothetical protein
LADSRPESGGGLVWNPNPVERGLRMRFAFTNTAIRFLKERYVREDRGDT